MGSACIEPMSLVIHHPVAEAVSRKEVSRGTIRLTPVPVIEIDALIVNWLLKNVHPDGWCFSSIITRCDMFTFQPPLSPIRVRYHWEQGFPYLYVACSALVVCNVDSLVPEALRKVDN